MKTIYKALILLLMCISSAMTFAQDNDPWVGTWYSESYQEFNLEKSLATKASGGKMKEIYDSRKLVIRITKNGGNYQIRTKFVNQNDPNDVIYGRECHVTEVSGNTIYYETYLNKDPQINNGDITEYWDITYYYKLTLTNGTLKFDLYNYKCITYDSGMRFVKEENDNYRINKISGNHLTLFNDDW